MTNDFIRSMIYGTLLGNSNCHSIYKRNKGITCGHGLSQILYLQHKANILNEYLNSNKTIKLKKVNSRYLVLNRQPFYTYYSRTSHKINQFYNILYCSEDNKKHITKEGIKKYFNKVSLAYLFMDNGCKETILDSNNTTKIRRYQISGNLFSWDEVYYLSNIIHEQFNIENKVYLEHKKYPCLKITTNDNRIKFRDLLEPYVIDSMKYKLFV